ncbi:MAG: hypothetical protein L6R37_005326 [Teloschistes peruensis]|nr:MAG: hypothetical protein L6R37_005326 [Teloschistes peruensis]
MPAKEAEVKALSSVKGAAVTKPSQKPKSQSKELAKQVAAKTEKLDKKSDKKSKKAKKEPTPVPSSDKSESDSDESMSSASSGSSDEKVNTSGAKANGTATNGGTKKIDADTSESSESSEDESKVTALARATAADSDDDSEDDSDEASEVEGKKTVPSAKAVMDTDSEDDSSEDDDETLETPGAVDAKVLNGKLEKVVSKEASSDDEDDSASASDSASDSSDEEEDEEDEEPAPSKKRKAETEPTSVSKKPKADAMAATFEDMAKANLFIGNLSWNVDEDWLVREFEKFGEVKNCRIVTDRETGRSRGFGYLEFVNYADGIKAQGEMQEAMIDGRTINLDFSQPKKDKPAGGDYQDRSKKYGDQTNPPSTTIFCANLAFGSTQEDVSDAFGEHAEVKAVRIPTDQETGQMKGFAYVEFNSIDDATAAFDAMKGTAINGRPIRVDYATSGGVNSGRGRGRGGFDRGGRGGGDRGGRGGRGRGGFSDRGGGRGGRGGSTNRGGFGDFKGKKMTF